MGSGIAEDRVSVTQYWLAEGNAIFTIYFSNLVQMCAVLSFEVVLLQATCYPCTAGLGSHGCAGVRSSKRSEPHRRFHINVLSRCGLYSASPKSKLVSCSGEDSQPKPTDASVKLCWFSLQALTLLGSPVGRRQSQHDHSS